MSRRYRIAFLMQQVLGHVTHSAALQSVVSSDPDIEPVWVPVTYWRPDGWVERLPGISPGTKGVLRAATDVWRTLATRGLDGALFNSPALATSVAPLLGRIPTTISLDVTPRQFDREAVHFGHSPDPAGSASRFKHGWNRGLLARCAAVAPWSNWARRSLESDYGLEAEMLAVIPPGIDAMAWAPQPVERSDLPQILFVGGDFRRKGGDLLLDWFRERGRGRCELQIVSADPCLAGADAADIHVHRDLRPNSAILRGLYWRSDLFVLPSRSEPFGIAAVEALGAGLPVIATAVGGLTDIVDPGVTGHLVTAGDGRALAGAIESLLGSPAGRRAMGQRGMEAVRDRFDSERNGRRLLDLVKSGVDRRTKALSRVADGAPAR